MIITGGKLKGQSIKTPEGETTRPSSALIKESLFNILQTQIYNSVFIDLFAGSGSVGLEALSRGASKAIFAESDPRNVRLIKENISKLSLENQCQIISKPVDQAIELLTDSQADIVFLDPPYELVKQEFINEIIIKIATANMLKPQGFLILQSPAKIILAHQPTDNLTLLKTRKYGISKLTLWNNK